MDSAMIIITHVIENKEYRNDVWRARHLRVMKAQHLKHISALDFIDDRI